MARRFDARRLVFVDESGFNTSIEAPEGESSQGGAGVR